MIRRTPLLAAALAIALAGCSRETPQQTGDTAASPTRAPPDRALAGREIREPLAAEDIEGAQLAGELACSFTQRGGTRPLLVAMADVADAARAQGVIRLGPSALRLGGVDAGGFNAMVHGARFTSGDLEARVVVTSDAPSGGGESPPFPAQLEIAGPAGTQRIDGEWTCGP